MPKKELVMSRSTKSTKCPKCGGETRVTAHRAHHDKLSVEVNISCSDCGWLKYWFVADEQFIEFE
jgi:RNase P subunit RPR2